MPVRFDLIVTADFPSRTAEFRLLDAHGGQLAYRQTDFNTISVSRQQGLFDLRDYLRHYVQQGQEVAAVAEIGVCIAEDVLGQEPLEDLGVRPDEPHKLTKADLMQSNIDLISHACEILDPRPSRQLDIEIIAVGANAISLTATTSNLDRLDFIIDGRPRLTIDLTDGRRDIDVLSDGEPEALEVKGYKDGELVAGRKIPLG